MRALAPSLFLLATSLTAADPVAVASPDGRLDITLREDAAGGHDLRRHGRWPSAPSSVARGLCWRSLEKHHATVPGHGVKTGVGQARDGPRSFQ